jgi:hypothetical protein
MVVHKLMGYSQSFELVGYLMGRLHYVCEST